MAEFPLHRTRRRARRLHRPIARMMGRPGLVARAVIYTLLTYLTFDIAFNRTSPTRASGSGALAEVARQPGGSAILALLSAGLLAYVLWRALQAFGRDTSGETTAWNRIGWAAIAIVYLVLLSQAVRILRGHPHSGGPSNNPVPDAARVLSWTGGPFWLGLVGAGLVVGGAVLALWGILHDHRVELTAHSLNAPGALAARISGAVGNVTRGALVVAIGIHLLLAAATDDPRKVKSLDAVLLAAAHDPLGPLWLGLAATGLLAFAAFSVVEARYRRL